MNSLQNATCFALATLALMISANDVVAAEHTLMPSPRTVHIGNFNATNRPVLTINSGDIVTLEAATQIEPEAVDASGVVAPSVVPQYVRDIYRDVQDRGPGPHVLTGPIFVNGAAPGDVLELRILSVDLAVGYGYNRQRPFTGTLPNEFTQFWQRVLPINLQAKTTEIAPGVDNSARPAFLRHDGRCAPAGDGTHRQRSAGRAHGQSRQQGSWRGIGALYAGACRGRAVLGG